MPPYFPVVVIPTISAQASVGSLRPPARVLSSVIFYKGNLKAYETPLVQAEEVNVPDRKATAFELQVPLAQLKPGFYTCQVNIVDDTAGKFVFPRLALLVR